MKKAFRRLIQGVWYLFAAGLILAAVFTTVAHLLTPVLNEHRADMALWTSKLLGVPVDIGELHANWRGNIPELTLTHVVTLDQDTHKPAFEIREVKIGFQLFTSLWKRKLVPEDIIISGALVTVVQDASGGFTIKDLPLKKGPDYKSYPLGKILDWIFSQPYLSLRDIDIYFVLPGREKRELTVRKVSLINHNDEHKLNGHFILQQAIPTQVEARIEWQGHLAEPEHIRGKAYLDLEGVSLSQWFGEKNGRLSELFSGLQLQQGVGGAGLWLIWEEGKLQEMQSVFQWYDLAFYSAQDKKTYLIDQLSGHLGWKREGEDQIIAGDNILINFPHHLWPATTFYLILTPTSTPVTLKPLPVKKADSLKEKANPYTSTLQEGLAMAEAGVKQSFVGPRTFRLQDLRIGYLELQDLLPILLANAGLSENWSKNISELSPQGEVQNFSLWLDGAWTDLNKLRLTGELKGVTFHPFRKYPGFNHLNARLSWNYDEGNLEVEDDQVFFVFPAFFENPLQLNDVKADLDLQYTEREGFSFQTKNAELSSFGSKIKADLRMSFPPEESPSIDMNANFSISKITEVSRFLPTRVMDKNLVSWLKEAFSAGRLESGRALVQGKWNLFPFDQAELKKGQKGRFEVSALIRDLDFHYAPKWPDLQEADGRVIFSGRSMTAIIDEGTLLDVPVKHVIGRIPYLGESQAQWVNLQGNLEADASDGLEFIHQSPLEEDLGKDLEDLQLTGPMKLGLSLSIPLAHPEKTKVFAKARLKNAILALPEWDLTLEQLNGAFEFTEKDLSAKLLQGKLWGETVDLQLSTVQGDQGAPSYVQADASFKLNIQQLQKIIKGSLSGFLSGVTGFEAHLKLYQGGTVANVVSLSSDLQGLSVDLPAPFGKAAAESRPFSLDCKIQSEAAFKAQIRYGQLIQALLDVHRLHDSRVIDIDSSQLKGRVKLAYPFDLRKPLEINLDRLIVNAGNAETMSSLDPHSFPPLNLSSRQFVYGNKNLGQLILITTPKRNGMLIQNLSLNIENALFKGRGQWTGKGQSQQSQLQGSIESSKVNQLLNRLGLPLRSLIVDKGRATFDLHWKGAPYGFSLSTLSGNFSFALEKGRIINLNESDNTKMDMGRMLSLFSLQTIPRRLSLDFSDLFEQGYSFDFMRGDFSLHDGSAYTTKPAAFEGPVAHITASGRIGLLAQDYNLYLSIAPHVTESLPVVAGALTLNPFIGAAAWVVNKVVLSKEVSRVATYNYQVTGTWDSPVWRSVQKR